MKHLHIILFIMFFPLTLISQVLQWEARYNHYANLSEYANDMTIDNAGNIYVTGQSLTALKSADYATAKYSRTGIPLWVSRFDGSGDSSDNGMAVAVDEEGNVYVTGTSGVGASRDIVTVKYDSNGVEQWVKTFSGSGDASTLPVDIGIDGTGNIYVAGQTGGGASMVDYLLIKYTTAGTEEWTKTYNGSADSNDFTTDMLIDGSSNIYITGSTRETGGLTLMTTVKYNQAGTEVWVAKNDTIRGEGKSIGIDTLGNIYVAGYGQKDTVYFEYVTAKYDPAGVQQWVAWYDGTGHQDDIATAIAVSPAGAVYVTGKSIGLRTNDDYATVKYTSSGVLRWVARYDNKKKKPDQATAIALDSEENVYVTGTSYGYYSAAPDIMTIQYDSAGANGWQSRYKGYVAGANKISAIAVDQEDAVIISGYSNGGMSGEDFLTLKYTRPNSLYWEFYETGTTKTIFAIEAINEDTAWIAGAGGNIYQTTDRGFVWNKQDTPPMMPDLLSIMFPTSTTGYAVGKRGYILKTTDAGITWIWMNNAGRNWSNSDLHRVHFWNEDSGYAAGKKGVVITTIDGGYTWSAVSTSQIKTMNDVFYVDTSLGWSAGKKGSLRKTTDKGATWETLSNSGASWTTLDLSKIAFHDSQNGWAAGLKAALLTTTDGGMTWKNLTPFTAAGRTILTTQYTQVHPVNAATVALSANRGTLLFATNDDGNSLTLSYSGEKEDLFDIDVTGATIWAVGKKGTVLRSSSAGSTLRSKRNLISPFHSLPEKFELHQNYPNPFNPSTIIKYSLAVDSRVTLKVFNILGQEITTLLHNIQMESGEHEVQFGVEMPNRSTQKGNSVGASLPGGLYFYHLNVTYEDEQGRIQQFSQVKKAMLIK